MRLPEEVNGHYRTTDKSICIQSPSTDLSDLAYSFSLSLSFSFFEISIAHVENCQTCFALVETFLILWNQFFFFFHNENQTFKRLVRLKLAWKKLYLNRKSSSFILLLSLRTLCNNLIIVVWHTCTSVHLDPTVNQRFDAARRNSVKEEWRKDDDPVR